MSKKSNTMPIITATCPACGDARDVPVTPGQTAVIYVCGAGGCEQTVIVETDVCNE